MRFNRIGIFLLLVIGVGTVRAQDQDATRAFYMGFTPLPYEISLDAILYTYDRIAEDADLIVHHFDNGVPWPEALDQRPYSKNIMDDWMLRRSLTPEGHRVVAAITPISITRDRMAPYRGERDEMPLPVPFDSYSFDHPDVIRAFIYYSQTVIDTFEPDYFLMGIEVNLLMKLRPDLWDAYMILHRETYTTLKARYPQLPIMVSLTGSDLLEGYTEADHADQMRALAEIDDYTDMLAFSIYPYLTAYATDSIPTDMFQQLAALSDKPLAVSETGYPAQSFRVGMGLNFLLEGTPELQSEWISLLLESAEQYDFEFVTHFVLRDYDSLWEAIGAEDDMTILWRDTGLYDEAGQARPSLDIWRQWLERPTRQD